MGSIGGSANIWKSKQYSIFLPHSTMNISSDKCREFPDSLFQVLNVVNINTVVDLFRMPQKPFVSCVSF
jgi:hypothetical protein